MKTVKGVRIHSYGGPGVLVYGDAPLPHPGAREVFTRAHAVGISPVDWKIREAHPQQMLRHTSPLDLGRNVSGVVKAVGPGRAAEERPRRSLPPAGHRARRSLVLLRYFPVGFTSNHNVTY